MEYVRRHTERGREREPGEGLDIVAKQSYSVPGNDEHENLDRPLDIAGLYDIG